MFWPPTLSMLFPQIHYGGLGNCPSVPWCGWKWHLPILGHKRDPCSNIWADNFCWWCFHTKLQLVGLVSPFFKLGCLFTPFCDWWAVKYILGSWGLFVPFLWLGGGVVSPLFVVGGVVSPLLWLGGVVSPLLWLGELLAPFLWLGELLAPFCGWGELLAPFLGLGELT